MIQNHSLDCVSNHAMVTWAEDKDAMSVTVNATSNRGHSTSCSSSTNNSCVLDKLKCGHTYNAQVVARGVKCLSKPSSTFQIVTGRAQLPNQSLCYGCCIYKTACFASWFNETFFAMLFVFPVLLSCFKICVTVCCEGDNPSVKCSGIDCCPLSPSALYPCKPWSHILLWHWHRLPELGRDFGKKKFLRSCQFWRPQGVLQHQTDRLLHAITALWPHLRCESVSCGWTLQQ